MILQLNFLFAFQFFLTSTNSDFSRLAIFGLVRFVVETRNKKQEKKERSEPAMIFVKCRG
jgi:hypothetical protein